MVKSELGSHEKSDQGGMKLETNGGGNTAGNDPGSSPIIPPESQSPLHFLADLAEQKSREEKKGKIEMSVMVGFSFYSFLLLLLSRNSDPS